MSLLAAHLEAGPRSVSYAPVRVGPAWSQIAAGLALAVYAAIQFRWVWLYRHGGLLDIDEAGYLAIALKDYIALRDGGWLAWIAAVEAPREVAPITTALTSLLFAAFGPHLTLGFVVPGVAMLVTIVATYFLGRSLNGKMVGWLAAVLVATMPLLVNFSRDFQFSVVATAITTLALLALVRSDGMSRWGAAVAFGVLVGLMPLARTVTISFVPGILFAAALSVLLAPERRAERLMRLAIAGVVAAAVAALWLGFNGVYVARYLLSAGYGARAAEYGQLQGFFEGLYFRSGRLSRGFHLASSAVVTVGLLLGLAFVLATIAGAPRKGARLAQSMRSPPASLAIFVVLGLFALASSRNVGAAFEAPLIPAVCVLAICGWLAKPIRRFGTLVRAIVLLAAALAFVPLMDLASPLARPVYLTVPLLGPTILTNGSGIQQLYETGPGLNEKNPGGPLPANVARKWWKLYERTAAKVHAAAHDHLVAYGMRGVMYNINNVNLALLLKSGRSILGTQISPLEVGSDVSGYEAWLTTGNAAAACVLLTSEGTGGELAPPPDTPNMREAARRTGFVVKESWPTPSGRTVEMWVRLPCE